MMFNYQMQTIEKNIWLININVFLNIIKTFFEHLTNIIQIYFLFQTFYSNKFYFFFVLFFYCLNELNQLKFFLLPSIYTITILSVELCAIFHYLFLSTETK